MATFFHALPPQLSSSSDTTATASFAVSSFARGVRRRSSGADLKRIHHAQAWWMRVMGAILPRFLLLPDHLRHVQRQEQAGAVLRFCLGEGKHVQGRIRQQPPAHAPLGRKSGPGKYWSSNKAATFSRAAGLATCIPWLQRNCAPEICSAAARWR